MKKILLVFTALLIIVSFSACHNQTNVNKDALDMIYEVDNKLYVTEKSFHHKKTISNSVEYSKETTPPSNVTFAFNGDEKEFVYCDTLFYPVGEKKVNRYCEKDKEDNVILLNEDGSINSILYEYTMLDLHGGDDPENILIELKKELSKWVDISKYEYIDINTAEGERTIYDYLFCNRMEGYLTDYMRVSVFSDGCFLSLSINNVMIEDFVLHIDKSLEEKMIHLKLADIYNTENTEYKSYHTVFPPQVVVYDNELCVQYFVAAHYLDSNETEQRSWLNCILIPTRLMETGK